MFMNVRLNENHTLLRVDATGEVQGPNFTGLGMEAGRVNALGYGQCVQVYDAEDGIIQLLEFHPEGERTYIVTDMKLAGGLDARKRMLFAMRMSHTRFSMGQGRTASMRRGSALDAPA